MSGTKMRPPLDLVDCGSEREPDVVTVARKAGIDWWTKIEDGIM